MFIKKNIYDFSLFIIQNQDKGLYSYQQVLITIRETKTK